MSRILLRFLLQAGDLHIRGSVRRCGAFQEWPSESVMRSRLPTYFELIEMREGLLQRPTELQLTFQIH